MAKKSQSFKRARPSTASTEKLFGWAEQLVTLTESFPNYRRMGTHGDKATREWLINTLKSEGCEHVNEQVYPILIRQYNDWKLSVDGDDIDCFFMNGAAFTQASGITGELIHIGSAIDPKADYTGKIVIFDLKSGPAMRGSAISQIADYTYDPDNILSNTTVGGSGGPAPSNFPAPYYEAARQGAVGFIGVFKDRESDANEFFADPTGMVQTTIPGLFLKGSIGTALVDQHQGQSACITLTGEEIESESGNIIVHVPGQKSDAMLVNTHHDGGWSGAVQDASGVATVVGLASYYQRFPSNYIQKDLYFVINGCHYGWNYPYGANKFAEMNPEIMKRLVLCFGVEHIAKRFVGKNGKLIDTGEIEPRFIWTPKNEMLYNAAVNAIEKNELHSTIIPKAGAIPLYGETQSYFLQGIPSFSIMSMPEYLFFSDDTIDKIPADELSSVMLTMLDIMDTAMYMPDTWIKAIDR